MSDKKTRFPRILLASVLALSVGATWAGINNANSNRGVMPLLDNDTVAALQLTPAQQQGLNQLRRESGLVAETVRRELGGLRQRLDSELGNPEPNLRRVFEQGTEARRQAIFGAIDQARESRLGFYDTLSPAQKRVVATRMEQRLQRFDRMRSMFGRMLLNQSIL